MSIDELRALAIAGGSTFTAAEAERVGIDHAALVRLVRTGVCVRLRRGLYALAADVPKWPDERHSVLALGVARQYANHIALSHHSALIAAGLPTWGVPYDTVRAVRVAGSHRGTRSGLTVGDGWPDDAYDSVEPRLIPAVACLQVAMGYGVEQAVVSLDAALVRGLTSTDQLAAWLDRLRGHRNVHRARQAVALANHLSESPGESRLRVRLHHLGYTDLEPQVWIKVNGRVLGRVDLLDRAHRVVIEFDGRVKYQGEKGSDAVVREKVREDAFRRGRYGVARYIWEDLDSLVVLRQRLELARLSVTHAKTA